MGYELITFSWWSRAVPKAFMIRQLWPICNLGSNLLNNCLQKHRLVKQFQIHTNAYDGATAAPITCYEYMHWLLVVMVMIIMLIEESKQTKILLRASTNSINFLLFVMIGRLKLLYVVGVIIFVPNIVSSWTLDTKMSSFPFHLGT